MNYHPSFTFEENPEWAWKFKALLLERLKEIPEDFSLSFSAGIDSSMILYGLMEINKPPKELITFQIESYETNDLKYSRKIAAEYNLPLKIITVPKVSKEEASTIIKEIVDVIGLSRKIDIQCCYAYYYMLQNITTDCLVAGLYEDIIYETNAKLSVMYRDLLRGQVDRKQFDDFYAKIKRYCYEDKNINGSVHNHVSIRKYIKSKGVTLNTPLQTESIFQLFQNINYEQSNFKIEDGKMIQKKKWFVTDLIFKNEFERFGNAKNKSNLHTKKEKGDVNTLHCEIFNSTKKNIIKEYNRISKKQNHKWF